MWNNLQLYIRQNEQCSPVRNHPFLQLCCIMHCLFCFSLFATNYDLLSSLMFCLPLYVYIYPSISMKMSLQAENTILVFVIFQENGVRVAVKKPDPEEKLLYVKILVLPLVSYITWASYLTSLNDRFLTCDNECGVLNMLLGIQYPKLVLASISGIHYQSTHSQCLFSVYLIGWKASLLFSEETQPAKVGTLVAFRLEMLLKN